MKARFTDEQIIAMIKEQEFGETTADVCRGMGSVQRRFTNTNRSMAGWNLLTRSG
jgi:putative transposase